MHASFCKIFLYVQYVDCKTTGQARKACLFKSGPSVDKFKDVICLKG